MIENDPRCVLIHRHSQLSRNSFVSELLKALDRIAHPQPNDETPRNERNGGSTQQLFSSDSMSTRKKYQQGQLENETDDPSPRGRENQCSDRYDRKQKQ